MTISEAIIQVLEDNKTIKTAREIFNHIVEKTYVGFSNKNYRQVIKSR